MSVLTDLIYGGSNAVAGLTEGAVKRRHCQVRRRQGDCLPRYRILFPHHYAATGVKVKTLGDLPACVGVLKS